MAYRIRRIDYYYTSVKDQPGEAYKVLSKLADLGVSLLAFAGVPTGPTNTQLTLFPENTRRFVEAAEMAGMRLEGPNRALLVQGDDGPGVLAGIHSRLFEDDVNVYAAQGVSDGSGTFGYILYVRPEEYERAAAALGI